jgi:hypothetical protein
MSGLELLDKIKHGEYASPQRGKDDDGVPTSCLLLKVMQLGAVIS